MKLSQHFVLVLYNMNESKSCYPDKWYMFYGIAWK